MEPKGLRACVLICMTHVFEILGNQAEDQRGTSTHNSGQAQTKPTSDLLPEKTAAKAPSSPSQGTPADDSPANLSHAAPKPAPTAAPKPAPIAASNPVALLEGAQNPFKMDLQRTKSSELPSVGTAKGASAPRFQIGMALRSVIGKRSGKNRTPTPSSSSKTIIKNTSSARGPLPSAAPKP